MNYADIFHSQWEVLCGDFSKYLKMKPVGGTEAHVIDQWYGKQISRWESQYSPEGEMLNQTENRLLSQELLQAMHQFRFEPVPLKGERTGMVKAAAILAAGIALCAGVCALLKTYLIAKIMLVILILAVLSLLAIRSLQESRKTVSCQQRQQYRKQLAGYGEHLTEICKKYQ